MARSAVTVSSASAYNTAADITKDAIDATNDHSISVSTVKTSQLAIFVETSTTIAITVAVKAGDYSDTGIGDLTMTAAAAKTQWVVVEGSRFKDSDDLILIDVTTTGATGYIYAVELP